MKILERKDNRIIVEMTYHDAVVICYVLQFAKGGVSNEVEGDMLKIVGVLEGATDEKD